VGKAPARPALAGVEEAQRPFAGVHAVVGLVGDEHHARALRQMAVVGDVHEHPLHRLLLDPAVIDGDERVQADRGGVLGVELDAELVQVHQSFNRQLCAASMKSWASSTSRCAASELGLFGGFSTALKKYWANLPPAKGSQKSFVSKNLSRNSRTMSGRESPTGVLLITSSRAAVTIEPSAWSVAFRKSPASRVSWASKASRSAAARPKSSGETTSPAHSPTPMSPVEYSRGSRQSEKNEGFSSWLGMADRSSSIERTFALPIRLIQAWKFSLFPRSRRKASVIRSTTSGMRFDGMAMTASP